MIFSVVIGIVSSLVLVPMTKIEQTEEEAMYRTNWLTYIVATTVLSMIIFGVYYVTNFDRNWSSLWFVFLVVTLLGVAIASQVARRLEQQVKGSLFLLALFLGVYVLSAPIFNANKKFELVEMDQEIEIEAFDETKTPASVPPKFARNKMKKAFGQVSNTSYYELGNLQVQKINGEYVYIAPVEFSGLFKWWNGKTIPGYFKMSATNASDNPKFIKVDMSYTPSSYFHKNVVRHMRMRAPNLIFYGDVQLEIDEEGKPFYIRSYGDFVTARNGFEVEGIVAVDATNGAIQQYVLADVPDFIDGAVAPEAISLQNSYFGKYIHGFWNSVFGKRDVKIPSDEGTVANVSPIFDENGDMYYFTDFTSPKEEVDSMLGYALTNGRTGKGTYYTGDLEASYMDSQGALQIIEKKFIEKKWSGEMPVLYNFYEQASWLIPVLDSNGFLQNYFIVSAANPEIAVYGNTPNAALKLYKTALQRQGSTVDGSSNAEENKAKIVVERFYKEALEDSTIVSILAKDGRNFLISSEVLPLAVYIQEGDELTVTYAETGELFLPVKEVVNHSLE